MGFDPWRHREWTPDGGANATATQVDQVVPHRHDNPHAPALDAQPGPGVRACGRPLVSQSCSTDPEYYHQARLRSALPGSRRRHARMAVSETYHFDGWSP